LLGDRAVIGWNLLEQWVFAKIVLDETRHIGVDGLVIGDAVTERIDERQGTGTHRLD
jgi:hypothetical protein